MMPPNHLILFCPLLLHPSILPSIRVFSSELALHIRWSKYWSFSFSIRPSSEYSRLISFRIDWFDLLAAQGTFKNLLQHHNLKSSSLWCSDFWLSQPYMTTGKTTPLTICISVGKLMVSVFCYIVCVCHSFSSKEQAFFNFMSPLLQYKIKSF